MAVKTVQATINGQTYTLTLNSTSGKYEATVTAPSKSSYNQSGHYYGVTVKATDVAGNITTKDAADATLGTSLRLQVKEKVAPIIAITAPTAGTYLTNNKPTITWKVTDTDSGVNPATIGITIDSGTKITGDSIKRRSLEDISVHTHRQQHYLMVVTQSNLMQVIMMEMQQVQVQHHSKLIQYHQH